MVTSNNSSDIPSTSSNDEIETYEGPPSLSEMASLYGLDFYILTKSKYRSNGCGINKRGIKVPTENNICETSFGLGYNLLGSTKAS